MKYHFMSANFDQVGMEFFLAEIISFPRAASLQIEQKKEGKESEK